MTTSPYQPTPYILDQIRGKEHLFFDFDGTIADTASLHKKAFDLTLSSLNITVDYPSIAGMSTRLAMISLSEGQLTPFHIDHLVSQKQALVRRLMKDELKAFPKVVDLLHWAYQHFQLTLVTSGSRQTVEPALSQLKLDSLFNFQVFADTVPNSKPQPDPYLHALKLANTSPGNALVFEDSLHGFLSASSAGIAYVDVKKAHLL